VSHSRFDRIAQAASRFASGGAFFTGCVALVLVWGLTYFAFSKPDTWQLVINTITTIVTFLLVALLQNAQKRGEAALQAKLDAIADGLADLMEYHLDHDDVDLAADVDDLKQAVGLERIGERT
jgi:low affinity Fe/Cu permease